MAERSFTIYQLADLLGVTPAEVRSWIDKGWLRCHKLDDRTYRISETQLVRFLKAQGIDIELILAKTVSSEEGHDEKTPEVEVPCRYTHRRRKPHRDFWPHELWRNSAHRRV